jgi:3-oxoacyl-[acyl-carrier protein] reductase
MEITMTLRGKRALVTGASRGIGAAIAKTLAYEGADVAITYEKSAESAAEVVSAIKAKGRRGVAIQADSVDAAAVQASVDTAVAEWVGLISSSTMQGFFDWASSRTSRSPISTRS